MPSGNSGLHQRLLSTLPPAQQQPIRAFRRAAGNTIDQFFTLHIAHIQHLAPFHQAEDNLIAGVNLINQSLLQRLLTVPVFARGDQFNVQSRTHPLHKLFEQMVRFVEIFTKLLPPFFRILA